MSELALVHRLYQAAQQPESWSDALGSICKEFGLARCAIYAGRREDLANYDTLEAQWGGSAGEIEDYVGHYQYLDHSLHRVTQAPVGAICSDEELLKRGDWQRESDFAGFVRRVGVGSTLFVVLENSPSLFATARLAFPRDVRRPSFAHRQLAARLAPHIHTAISLHRRISSLEARQLQLADALERLVEAVAAIDSSGTVYWGNSELGRTVQQSSCISVEQGRLRLRDPQLEASFHRAVVSASAGGLGSTLALPRLEGAPLEVTITPSRSVAVRGLQRPCALVFIRDPGRGSSDFRAYLRQGFALTQSEAAVASHLALGASLEDIATELGIRIATVRCHLARVFRKTRTKRQPELVTLLLNGRAQAGETRL